MKRSCLFMVVCLLAISVIAEEPKPSYPFTVEKSIGTATFANRTYDEVWGGVVKALVKGHYRLAVVEKDAGIIEAEYNPADSKFWGRKPSEGRAMSALVEAGPEAVSVSLTWDRGSHAVLRGMQAQLRKVYGQMFQQIADFLYPPDDAKEVD